VDEDVVAPAELLVAPAALLWLLELLLEPQAAMATAVATTAAALSNQR
jgi:hypothetical protein